MPYKNFTDYPLWQEASALTDSIFDFSRGIEDFSLRNRMTGAAVEIPFLIGEAAQSDSDKTMKSLLWRVEDPVNELRSVLKESKEQGFAPGADYELMQDRCRTLFQKVHTEASSPMAEEKKESPESTEPEPEPIVETAEPAPTTDSETDPFLGEGRQPDRETDSTKETIPTSESTAEELPRKKQKSATADEDDDFDINALI